MQVFVACRGFSSCVNSNTNSSSVSVNFKVTNTDSSIFCGACASCGDVNGDYQASFESNYNIYCYGIGACPDAILFAKNIVLYVTH